MRGLVKSFGQELARLAGQKGTDLGEQTVGLGLLAHHFLLRLAVLAEKSSAQADLPRGIGHLHRLSLAAGGLAPQLLKLGLLAS